MTVTVMINPSNFPFIDESRITDAVNEAVANGMRGGVDLIVADAKRSVARGPKTGRIYSYHGIRHQASAPGEPPATNTGVLINSIVGEVTTNADNKIQGYVRAGAGYAGYLEFGTRRMAARPFLNPAIERNKAQIAVFLQRAIETGLARFRTVR